MPTPEVFFVDEYYAWKMAVSHLPTWSSANIPADYKPLEDEISVDVAIMGSGLTGITTAYVLSQSDLKIAILEKDTLESSTTFYTTAFLTAVIDTELKELVSLFGKEKTKLIYESGTAAIDFIENTIQKEHIACDFTRCAEYMYSNTSKAFSQLEQEINTAHELGFDWTLHTDTSLHMKNSGYISIPHQAKFHPLKYAEALRNLAHTNGVAIYEHTPAVKLQHTDPQRIETPKGLVKAKHVIIATYDPFNHPLSLFGKKGMYTSYVLELALARGILKEGLYLDQENPYHYFRVDSGGKQDRVILGGEDHRHEIPVNEAKSYSALEAYFQSILPDTQYTIKRAWNGPILEPSDGLPYIGALTYPNTYVAMAFSGNGMTYATIAAMIFNDLIFKQKNPWIELYNPLRIPSINQLIAKGKDYTEELFGGAVKNIL